MSIQVEFRGGPADGTVREYPFERALPSLYWQADVSDDRRGVYRREGDAPDSITGLWRYAFGGAR
ncbi:hypothetical protein [Pseudonocardia sp. GCM10023141]|uniref:hypothetical protein n=1 Tax=Pseudonocardia sp. GCM10023141 TaxID=3252653 RepID=UPI00361612A3